VEILRFVAAGIGDIIGTADGCVQLVCGPIYHSAQWVFGIMPLLQGATVVLQHAFDAAGVLDLIDRHGVTNTHLVPAQFVRLLRLPDEVKATFSGSTLRQVHHGAAPCPPEVKRQILAWWGPIVTEYYGGTEGGFLTAITAEEWLERPDSVGRPLPLAEILVVGDDGGRLGPGEVGDLYFRSLVGSDFSYHNAPEKTEAAHLEAGVGTLGDIGWIDEDGYVFLSDRRIDMVVSGGVNIYPAEVERVLGDHPAVADVAVLGIPDDEMGERVLAVVELADDAEPGEALEADLDAHARRHLAGYKCPRAWAYCDQLPRSEAGKLLKRELREPYWATVGRAI
jgi:long-chain acyl-CoA synthetase